MNREILFRGKRVDNGRWVYGSLIHRPANVAENPEEYTAIAIFDKHANSSYNAYLELDVDPATVGQFIGLTDKNGVKIFEGDVVFNSNKTLLTLPEDPRTYEIVWSEGQYDNENKWLSKKPSFSFRKIQPNNKRYMELIFNKSQIEVIGNIHDNPELIKRS